jgi:hypothetical protein
MTDTNVLMAIQIAEHAAKSLQGKDWHKLSIRDRELVNLLEDGGYLIPNVPANGFVGKATAV